MRDVEHNARLILNSAALLNTEVQLLIDLYVSLGCAVIQLNDAECKALAQDYPYTFDDIEGWFQ